MERLNKIILADDDADDRDMFIDLLAQPDVDVRAVANGNELLSYLEGQRADSLPDCIFLDLNMPVMGGKECLSRIKADDKLTHIPVIIYSTSSNKKDIDDTFEMGADLYVVKDSSYVSLKKTLESIIRIDWEIYRTTKSFKNFVFKPA